MSRIVFIILLICCSSVFLFSQDANVFFQEGKVQLEAKKYDVAIKNFDEAIKLKPNFWVAYRGKALCLFAEKRYADAMTVLGDMHPNFGDPEVAFAYKMKGDIHKLHDNLWQAEYYYDLAGMASSQAIDRLAESNKPKAIQVVKLLKKNKEEVNKEEKEISDTRAAIRKANEYRPPASTMPTGVPLAVVSGTTTKKSFLPIAGDYFGWSWFFGRLFLLAGGFWLICFFIGWSNKFEEGWQVWVIRKPLKAVLFLVAISCLAAMIYFGGIFWGSLAIGAILLLKVIVLVAGLWKKVSAKLQALEESQAKKGAKA